MRIVYDCRAHVKYKPAISRHLVDTWFIHLGLSLR